MERHTDNVQNLAGDAVSAVTVTVRRVSDNALASLFSDNLASPTVKANPFTNDADGELFFYAFNNDYNIELSGPISETRFGVTLFDQNDAVIRRNIISIIASGTISQGDVALVDVTAGAITITLPPDPGASTQFSDVVIQHLAGDIAANNITIDRNGELIGGLAADVTMNIEDTRAVLIWGGSTLGWAIDLSSGTGGGAALGSLSDVTLSAPVTGGVLYKSAGDWLDTEAFFIDPAAEVQIKFNDFLAFQTAINGVSVHPSEGADTATVSMIDAAGEICRIEKNDAVGVGVLFNEEDGRGWVIQANDIGSVAVNMAAFDPDDSADLYFDAFLTFRTTALGVDIFGNGAAADSVMNFTDGDSEVGSITKDGAGGFLFANLEAGEDFFIQTTDATQGLVSNITITNRGNITFQNTTAGGGAVNTMATMDADAEVQLFHNDTRTFQTDVQGIRVFDTSGSEPSVLFYEGNTLLAEIQSTSGDFFLDNRVLGSGFFMRGSDVGALDTSFIRAIMNGAIEMYFDNTLELSTKSGGALVANELEIDGDLNHDGSNVGFFGVAAAAQTAAYIQTFSTASRTHENPTAASLTDSTGGSANQTLVAVPVVNGSGATTAQEGAINDNFADVTDEINKLITDLANLKEIVNSLIDDGQIYGLLQ